MRIGIITHPLVTNYGGILQNFALQTVLKRMGHEVTTTEKKRVVSLPLWKVPLAYGKRILLNVIGKKTPIFLEQKENRLAPFIQQNTLRFQNTYINKKVYNDYKDIESSEYDAFVVGSDQIWRREYFKAIEQNYLKFAENWNVKRIAYAASFGTDKWEYSRKQTRECGRLLKLFDAVSVREKSGVTLCKKYFNVDAVHVLDPTMLLDAEDYIRTFEAANTPISSGSLFVYVLDKSAEKEKVVQQIAKDRGLKPFQVYSEAENVKAPTEERVHPPVEQWLRGFYDADFVITDSFHGTVFSILFKKPFIVFGNEARGMSRFSSLLSTFGLQERLVTDLTKINNLGEIDWNSVYEKLSQLRAFSMNYLTLSLNK